MVEVLLVDGKRESIHEPPRAVALAAGGPASASGQDQPDRAQVPQRRETSTRHGRQHHFTSSGQIHRPSPTIATLSEA